MATIQVIGRLGADAEDKGEFIAFRIAETTKVKQGGQLVESTTWYSCSSQNKAILGFLKVGKPILVRGYHSIPRDEETGMPRLNSAGTDVLQNIARAEVEFLPMPAKQESAEGNGAAPAPATNPSAGTETKKKPFFSKKQKAE